MKEIKFGVVGCGLMGKEFAGAAARWCHLDIEAPAPKIIGVADPNPAAREWFVKKCPDVRYAYSDYQELLENNEIEAVYCAVPHVMHEKIYCDIIRAGKHLLAEKPFGMDKKQNDAILQTVHDNPEVFVRCTSQFPFYPGCQALIKRFYDKQFGKIIEVRSGIKHSSDLDLNKPINWKRKVEINGAYGCMGDLGIHTQHVPFRLGFKPLRVYAQLSKIVKERPDGKGGLAKCETWDNAILNCTAEYAGEEFPMILETKRMAPGSTNEWYIEIYGLKMSARFSTNDPNALYFTQALGQEQSWCRVNIGYKPQFPAITGGIFEFGFTDAVLQMWAAFMMELSGQKVEFGCFTPEETALSHSLQTAALQSHMTQKAVEIKA